MAIKNKFYSFSLLGKGGTKEEMLEELAKAIKRFAKRQMTWFRRNPDIRWLDMRGDPLEQAAELTERFLNEG